MTARPKSRWPTGGVVTTPGGAAERGWHSRGGGAARPKGQTARSRDVVKDVAIGYNPGCSRRGGRAVECGGLENRCASQEVPGVRIPPSPLRDDPNGGSNSPGWLLLRSSSSAPSRHGLLTSSAVTLTKPVRLSGVVSEDTDGAVGLDPNSVDAFRSDRDCYSGLLGGVNAASRPGADSNRFAFPLLPANKPAAYSAISVWLVAISARTIGVRERRGPMVVETPRPCSITGPQHTLH